MREIPTPVEAVIGDQLGGDSVVVTRDWWETGTRFHSRCAGGSECDAPQPSYRTQTRAPLHRHHVDCYTIFGCVSIVGNGSLSKANFSRRRGSFPDCANRCTCKLKTSTPHSIDPAPVSTEYPACTEALAQTDNCRKTRS